MPIIDYHYVRNDKKSAFKLPGYNIAEFKKHLDFFQNQYQIVRLEELARYKNEKKDIEKYCSIIFDDGVIDHYESVFPELVSRNIPAYFFPIASVFDGKAPVTIKMHIVFSKIKSEIIAEYLEQYLKEKFGDAFPNFKVPTTRRINEKFRLKDDIITANLKQIISELPLNVKEKFADLLFSAIVKDEKEFCKNFFLQPEHLKEMRQAGMGIGVHSYHHTSLKSLNLAEQKEDIEKSKNIIENIINGTVEAFSYPFGDCGRDTTCILKDLGFQYGVIYNSQKTSLDDSDLLLSAGEYDDFFKH